MDLFLSEGNTPRKFLLMSPLFISLNTFSISKLEIPLNILLIKSFTNQINPSICKIVVDTSVHHRLNFFVCYFVFNFFMCCGKMSMVSFIIVLPRLEPAALLPKSIAMDRSIFAPAYSLLHLFLGSIVLFLCHLGSIFLM